MIYLEKNIQTTIALTLSEVSQFVNPFFWIEIYNEFNSYAFHAVDISGYKERANIFQITANLPQGEYEYKCYESDFIPTNLGETTGIVLEHGICIIHSIEDIEQNVYL
jgi:hypothetical protein